MELNADSKKPVHIAILPGPGVGHLNPLLEFSKRLIQTSPNSFSITFITVPASSSDDEIKKLTHAQTSFLSTLPDGAQVEFLSLPPPMFSNEEFPTFSEDILARIFLSVKRSLSPLRDLLVNVCTSKKGPVASLFVDMFATDAIEVAMDLGIDPYLCFPSGAMDLLLFMHAPEMARTVSGEFVDMTEPVRLPGCVPLHGKDFPDPLLDRRAQVYNWFLEHAKRYSLAKGIVLNTFEALEVDIIRALREPGNGIPAIYPIAPLTKTVSSSNEDDDRVDCLKWLDQQPPESVLFVSFGSGGTLSTKQVNEIASGLEMSGQRFLWVVRVPNDSTPYGSYLGFDGEKNPLDFLPDGFLERTKGHGLAVPNWAPQVLILSHGSTGGFLTHCGWNSILEGAVSGVPFIAWPLFAEQKMNAVFLQDDLKVAQRVRPEIPDGLVKAEQIARLIKTLMTSEEGKEIKRKMKVLKDEAAKAVAESGSSSVALRELATKLSSYGKLTQRPVRMI